MPQASRYLTPTNRPPQPTGSGLSRYVTPPEPTSDKGSGVGTTAAIGAGLLGIGALAARNPALARSAGGKALKALNVGRQQLMLSGYALPKSMVGGAGAAVERAVETKSLRPLKEFFSPQTARDAVTAFKTSTRIGPAGTPTSSKYAIPGRAIGAFDTATHNALQRSGASADEATEALLQKPLGPGFAVLENPVAQYAHPFRRTPFNQWFEGYGKFQRAYEGDKTAQRGLALYGGAGAAHGAATADERFPVSVPFGVAGAARYGVPYGLGALLGRSLAGSKTGGGIADQINPVGAYGVEQGFLDPLRPVEKPSFLRWLGK